MPTGAVRRPKLRRVAAEAIVDPWHIPQAQIAVLVGVEHGDVVAAHAAGVARACGELCRGDRGTTRSPILRTRCLKEVNAGIEGSTVGGRSRGHLHCQARVACYRIGHRIRLVDSMTPHASREVDHVLIIERDLLRLAECGWRRRCRSPAAGQAGDRSTWRWR